MRIKVMVLAAFLLAPAPVLANQDPAATPSPASAEPDAQPEAAQQGAQASPEAAEQSAQAQPGAAEQSAQAQPEARPRTDCRGERRSESRLSARRDRCAQRAPPRPRTTETPAVEGSGAEASTQAPADPQ
jgi:hypothetical protein